jgi:hypothetical protein
VAAGETATLRQGVWFMEAFKNKSINFWPFRRAVILIYNEKVISREKFIELWEAIYGND